MKPKTIIICVLIILTFTNVVLAVNTHTNTNSNKVNINENLEFTINFEEKAITADFSILFDSDKWEYIKEDTDKIETNYIKETSEIICCYYDQDKKGIDNISLKFKAKQETNKTKFKVTNITIHTITEEKQIADLESPNIRIVKKEENNNIIANNSKDETVIKNNISNNFNIEHIENNTENNKKDKIKDDTKVSTRLPKAGIRI